MRYLAAAVAAVVVLWVALVLALLVARPKGLRSSEAVRFMPDLVLLVRDLARDPEIPRRIRARILLLLAWMASPIDAIPDVIPVVGVADDVILAYLVLRGVVRACGRDALARHWRGTPESLEALEHLLGVEAEPVGSARRHAATDVAGGRRGRRP